MKGYQAILLIAPFCILAFFALATHIQPLSVPAFLIRDNLQKRERNPTLLLPDLQTAPLAEAHIITQMDGGKILRFPTAFNNTGDGPLELLGQKNPDTQTTQVTQRIYRSDGSTSERTVGYFIFHSPHEHWHFENFVETRLLSLNENNQPDKVVASTGKMTFCLRDDKPLSQKIPGKPRQPAYPHCDPFIQGISVGWSDVYGSQLPGQELDVTDLEPGVYAFQAIADPENRIEEKDEANNISVSYIRLSQNEARVFPAP